MVQLIHFFQDGQPSTLALKDGTVSKAKLFELIINIMQNNNLGVVQIRPRKVLALLGLWESTTVEKAELVWTLFAHLKLHSH